MTTQTTEAKKTETKSENKSTGAPPKSIFSMDYKDDSGKLLVKTTKVHEFTKGAWATVGFEYQELDKATGEYGDKKFSLRRFKKQDGAYKQKSKFNISSVKQATAIVGVLKDWI